MALPKRRHSKARTRKGRTHKKLSLPPVTLCPQCTEPKRPHRVCLNCGSYKGNTVVDVKEV